MAEAHSVNRETVSSVGVIMGRTLPFVTGNTTIKTFRHALALDEVCASLYITTDVIADRVDSTASSSCPTSTTETPRSSRPPRRLQCKHMTWVLVPPQKQ